VQSTNSEEVTMASKTGLMTEKERSVFMSRIADADREMTAEIMLAVHKNPYSAGGQLVAMEYRDYCDGIAAENEEQDPDDQFTPCELSEWMDGLEEAVQDILDEQEEQPHSDNLANKG
jgi:hypothetical protein